MEQQDVESLERGSHSFRVAGEEITLTEMGGKRMMEFTRRQIRAQREAERREREVLSAATVSEMLAQARAVLEESGEVTDQDRYEKLWRAVQPLRSEREGEAESALEISMQAQNGVFAWLLGKKDDWVDENLSLRMRSRIMDKQNELNGLGAAHPPPVEAAGTGGGAA